MIGIKNSVWGFLLDTSRVVIEYSPNPRRIFDLGVRGRGAELGIKGEEVLSKPKKPPKEAA